MDGLLSFLAGFILVFGGGILIYNKIMLDIDKMFDDSIEEDEEKWD